MIAVERMPGAKLEKGVDIAKALWGLPRADVFEPFFTTKPAGRGTGPLVARGLHSSLHVNESTGSRIVVVEDDVRMAELLAEQLSARGFSVDAWHTAEEALVAVDEFAPDLVLTDLNLGDMDGLELCRRVTAAHPDVPVVIITAFGSLDTAIGAIRAGAYDFVTKPFELEQLFLTLERAIRLRRLQTEVRRLRTRVAGAQPLENVIGNSWATREITAIVNRVASSDASVLIHGESGTGKELIARAIHGLGPRHDGPFVVANMAAIPAQLLESELFGHARGAFTDAKRSREGLLLEADRGTLVLDEIGDMPLELQPKLLRVLEERTIRTVGTNTEIPFDARVVATTNRDLEAAVEAGDFRRDLFYRLNVVEITVPPLRTRGDDVLVIAQHFLDTYADRSARIVARISTAAAEKLMSYPWPGNVRELRNCIERAVALAQYDELTVGDLSPRIRDYRPQDVLVVEGGSEKLVPLDVVERQYILRVLEAVGGNKSVAARTLQVGRKTLYRKLERYGLMPEPHERESPSTVGVEAENEA